MDEFIDPDFEQLIDDRCEDAIIYFTKTIDNSKETSQEISKAFLNRATCYMKNANNNKAIKDIKSCISLDKNNAKAYRQLAMCYMLTEEIPEAKNTLNTLLTICTDKTEIDLGKKQLKNYEEIETREIKAKEAFEKEDYKLVIKLMDECIERLNICLRHRILKAKSLLYTSQFHEAIYVINDILFTNKDESEAIGLRGLNLIYQGKYRLGIEDLRQSLFDSPNSRVFYDTYKDCEELRIKAHDYKKNGELEKSHELFTKIFNKDDKNLILRKEMYIAIAEIEFLQKKYTEALQKVNNALKIQGDDVDGLKLRGQIYEKMNKYKEAVEDYEQLVKIKNTAEHIDLLKNAKKKL